MQAPCCPGTAHRRYQQLTKGMRGVCSSANSGCQRRSAPQPASRGVNQGCLSSPGAVTGTTFRLARADWDIEGDLESATLSWCRLQRVWKLWKLTVEAVECRCFFRSITFFSDLRIEAHSPLSSVSFTPALFPDLKAFDDPCLFSGRAPLFCCLRSFWRGPLGA